MKRRSAKVYVFDSFAMVGYLGNEPSAPVVRDLLKQARKKTIELWLSFINYGEVVYIIERERCTFQGAVSPADQRRRTTDRRPEFKASNPKFPFIGGRSNGYPGIPKSAIASAPDLCEKPLGW